LFQAIGNEADITMKWTVAVAIFTEMNLSPQSFAVIKVSSSLPESDNQSKMALRIVQHILMEDILPRLVIVDLYLLCLQIRLIVHTLFMHVYCM